MRKTNKKGFTIVELVVVVAVIAILAAVLIPTFNGIINKANQSADQKAIRDMNVALAAAEATEKPETFPAAVDALLDADINIDKYKALAKDMEFYWVKALNRVVYVDKDMKVTYPQDYVGTTYDMEDGWYSLSGDVETSTAWKENKAAGTVSIASGAELVSLMEAFNKKDSDVSGISTIKLTADVDLKGAAMNFGAFTADVVFDGNNHTVYNIRNGASATNSKNNAANELTSYGYGLFGQLKGGAEVEVKNVIFSGVAINGTPGANAEAAGHAGVVAGSIAKNAKLTVTNVTIENCTISTEKKAGALVGYVQPGSSLTVNGLTVTNTTVSAGREAAALVGYMQINSSSVSTDAVISIQNLTMTNVTVEHDASYGYTLSADGTTATKDGETKVGITADDCWYIKVGVKETKNYH